MLLKNAISVMMCGLMICWMVLVTCSSGGNSVDSDTDTPIVKKDGIITVRIYETTFDQGNAVETCIDSMDIIETKHRVFMDNAIPFTFPVLTGTSMYFGGRFTDMPEPATVFIWYTAQGENRIETNAVFLKSNTGTTLIKSPQSPRLDEVNGYITVFDDDYVHGGSGAFEIWNDTLSTLIYIKPELHSVILPDSLPTTKIKLQDTNRQIRVASESSLEFNECTDGAVVCIEYTHIRDGGQSIRAFPSFKGHATTFLEDTATEFKIWGFVPIFNKNGE